MSNNNKSWFEVDKDGLKELQSGKPSHYILRELIQNAWDEDIGACEVNTSWKEGIASITVVDDSPEGFRDLSHAYTLYAKTYKRAEPEKRGRFNLGEKQILSLCEEAIISTTKGTINFTKDGRKEFKHKRITGSAVQLFVKMKKRDFIECDEVIKTYLPPENIVFLYNNIIIPHRKPHINFVATLPTEFEKDGVYHKTNRKTIIDVHITEDQYLYEMGIPVMRIDSKYSIDVQQKIPLSTDRDTVSQSFLKILLAEVLNNTIDELRPDESSETWVREASSSKRISDTTVKKVINKRYGDKVVVATPTDPNSIDEAISRGYRVIRGRELSKEEWAGVKKADAIKSSYELFPTKTNSSTPVSPNTDMLNYAQLVKRIAQKVLGIDVTVNFAKWGGAEAQYGDRILTFNTKHLIEDKFKELSSELIDLTIHELAHEKGNHTEHNYHQACTKIGGELTLLALNDPSFFNCK